MKNFCTSCNSEIIEHADGSLYCSCDALEIAPTGKIPEGWELNEDTIARYQEASDAVGE